jgi:hypothetical protein
MEFREWVFILNLFSSSHLVFIYKIQDEAFLETPIALSKRFILLEKMNRNIRPEDINSFYNFLLNKLNYGKQFSREEKF